MKKLIGAVAIAAVLATSAFAEGFSFGAWNNMNYVIANNDDNNVQSAMMQPWGPSGARYGSFAINADGEYAGFKAELHFGGLVNDAKKAFNGQVDFGQVFSYVKPIEQIQLIFGFTDQNYLRSDNVAYMFNYYRPGAFGLGEGITFSEFEVSGIGLVITPMDSLKIFAGYDVDLGGEPGKLHEQIGRSGKLGAAYTIGDIGTVKAGVWAHGKNADKDGKEKDLVDLGVAFDLTAFEGVFVTVGAKIPLGGTYDKLTVGYKKKTGAGYDDDTDWSDVENYDSMDVFKSRPIEVNAGVALNLIENLGIQLNFGSKINAPQVKSNGLELDGQFGFAIELGVDYTFAESWKVFGAVGYANDVYNCSSSSSFDKDSASTGYMKQGAWTTKDTVTFGVGIEKSFSNAALGVAFVGMTNDSNFYFIEPHNDTAFNWAIPIRMNVSF